VLARWNPEALRRAASPPARYNQPVKVHSARSRITM